MVTSGVSTIQIAEVNVTLKLNNINTTLLGFNESTVSKLPYLLNLLEDSLRNFLSENSSSYNISMNFIGHIVDYNNVSGDVKVSIQVCVTFLE